MVKQLRILIYFLTLSCADLRFIYLFIPDLFLDRNIEFKYLKNQILYNENRYWSDQIRDQKKWIKINPSGWVHAKNQL